MMRTVIKMFSLGYLIGLNQIFCKSVVSISLCNGDYNATVAFLVLQQIYILKHYQLNDSSCNLL
jgi:hypothetical protein